MPIHAVFTQRRAERTLVSASAFFGAHSKHRAKLVLVVIPICCTDKALQRPVAVDANAPGSVASAAATAMDSTAAREPRQAQRELAGARTWPTTRYHMLKAHMYTHLGAKLNIVSINDGSALRSATAVHRDKPAING